MADISYKYVAVIPTSMWWLYPTSMWRLFRQVCGGSIQQVCGGYIQQKKTNKREKNLVWPFSTISGPKLQIVRLISFKYFSLMNLSVGNQFDFLRFKWD